MTAHAPTPAAPTAPPNPDRGAAQRVARGVYVGALALPFACLAVLDRAAIATWISRGTCPGGAMDQVARPCGSGEFFVRVFLGGWVAFLVVPALLGWWLVASVAFVAARRRLRRT